VAYGLTRRPRWTLTKQVGNQLRLLFFMPRRRVDHVDKQPSTNQGLNLGRRNLGVAIHYRHISHAEADKVVPPGAGATVRRRARLAVRRSKSAEWNIDQRVQSARAAARRCLQFPRLAFQSRHGLIRDSDDPSRASPRGCGAPRWCHPQTNARPESNDRVDSANIPMASHASASKATR